MKFDHLLYTNLLSLFLCLNFYSAHAAPTTEAEGINLNIKVFLKGALIGTGEIKIMMRDDLRAQAFLPATEPYSGYAAYAHQGQDGGGESITDLSVFKKAGNDAIVDWVFIELREPDDAKIIVATRSALVQRDGDVVDMDGISTVRFANTPAGEYYVAVRHRNHLGIMTSEKFDLGKTNESIDFTDPDFPVYGINARVPYGEKMAMQVGDFNQDRKVIYQGPQNELFYLTTKVLSSSDNVDHASNHMVYGYHLTDLNMDGTIMYAGPNNDRALFFVHIIGLNNQGVNYATTEQLP